MKIRALAGSAAVLAATTVTAITVAAAPASAVEDPVNVSWQFDGNMYTPLLWGESSSYNQADDCHYRLYYGNYGNVAFAKLRMYSGCSGYTVWVWGARGTDVHGWKNTGGAISASDTCEGHFIEVQATSEPNRIAVGATALSGRPFPDYTNYNFDHTGWHTRPAIPSSRVIHRC